MLAPVNGNEDPNYFDNRRAAGIHNPNGLFSRIFG